LKGKSMNTFESIAGRRSIRKFKEVPVPEETIRRLLHAATLAPSGKNRQPWRFYVVRGNRRAEMLEVMQAGIEKHKAEGMSTGSSEHSARVMEQAPVTIFVFNSFQENSSQPVNPMDNLMNVVDVQSVGAAIQNMHLAAQDMGIGALWICDIFYAYDELCDWLGESHQMVAAISLGYANQAPAARPRKPVEDVAVWL
jgi:nitroreductase